MFEYKTFEEIVLRHCVSEIKGEKLFQRKNDLARVLFSMPSSKSESVLLKGITDYSLNNYRKTGTVKEKIVQTFCRREPSYLAQVYYDALGHYLSQKQEELMAAELVQLIESSENLSPDTKEAVLSIDRKGHFDLFFATLLREAVLFNKKTYLKQNGSDAEDVDTKPAAHTHHLPPPTPWFCGRQEEISEIKDLFSAGFRTVVVSAPGGFGKTQLARKYAQVFSTEYSDIFWISDVSESGNIIAQYADLLDEDEVLIRRYSDNVVLTRFQELLANKEKWLIIFDNADLGDNQFFNAFKQVLPVDLSNGNLLITARSYRQLWQSRNYNLTTMENDVDAAVQFLMARSEEHNKKHALRLAQRLSFYPLAMELAGAFIAETPGCNLDTYYEMIETNVEVLNKSRSVTDYSESIGQIIQSTGNRIKSVLNLRSDSSYVEDFLVFCSFGHGKKITPSLFPYFRLQPEEEGCPSYMSNDEYADLCTLSKRLKESAEYFKDDANRLEVTNLFIRYGLLSNPSPYEKNEIIMHDILQEIIRHNACPSVKVQLELSYLMIRMVTTHHESLGYNGDDSDLVLFGNLSSLFGVVAHSWYKMGNKAAAHRMNWLRYCHAAMYKITLALHSSDMEEEETLRAQAFQAIVTAQEHLSQAIILIDRNLISLFHFHLQAILMIMRQCSICEDSEKIFGLLDIALQGIKCVGNADNEDLLLKTITAPKINVFGLNVSPIESIIVYPITLLANCLYRGKYNETILPLLDKFEGFNRKLLNGKFYGVTPAGRNGLTRTDLEDNIKTIEAYRAKDFDSAPGKLKEITKKTFIPGITFFPERKKGNEETTEDP